MIQQQTDQKFMSCIQINKFCLNMSSLIKKNTICTKTSSLFIETTHRLHHSAIYSNIPVANNLQIVDGTSKLKYRIPELYSLAVTLAYCLLPFQQN